MKINKIAIWSMADHPQMCVFNYVIIVIMLSVVLLSFLPCGKQRWL